MTHLDKLKHHIRTEWAKPDPAVIAPVASSSLRVRWGQRRSFGALFVYLDIVISAITTTFLTVVDQSNTYTQIARPVWFSCSCHCQLWLCSLQ